MRFCAPLNFIVTTPGDTEPPLLVSIIWPPMLKTGAVSLVDLMRMTKASLFAVSGAAFSIAWNALVVTGIRVACPVRYAP